MTAPIVSFLQFFIKPQHREPFEAFMRRILKEAREYPGCLYAYCWRMADMEPQYIVLSGWTDKRVMQDFEEVPRHVRAARMGEEEFFAQPMIMRHYERFE